MKRQAYTLWSIYDIRLLFRIKNSTYPLKREGFMTWYKLNWKIAVCGILSMVYSVFQGHTSMVKGGWISIVSAVFFDTDLFDTDLFIIDLHAGGMMGFNNLFYYKVAYTAAIGALFILLAFFGMKKEQSRTYMAIHTASIVFALIITTHWSFAVFTIVHLIICPIALLIYLIIGVHRFMKVGGSTR